MKMFITDVLQLSPSDELNIDLFGLNHLVFVRDVLVNGVSRFDELLDGVASGRLTANSVKNIFDLPFSEGLIRSLRLIPCSYLPTTLSQKRCWRLRWASTIRAARALRWYRRWRNSC